MSEPLKPFPWQKGVWESLITRMRADRLPHALLFTGPMGLGKSHLVRAFAQSLLCNEPAPDGSACGHCRGCGLFAAGSHPDYTQVLPEEEGKALTVDQVRRLTGFQGLTGQYGDRRVVVIEPADRLNVNAANALLKTLEEPTAGTVLLLVSNRPSALLPTIRSRCQQIALPPASLEQAGDWLNTRLSDVKTPAADLLAMAGGAPLAALALAQGEQLAARAQLFDILEGVATGQTPVSRAAATAAGLPLADTLAWVHNWLADMVRLKSCGSPTLANPDLRSRLQALADRVDLKPLFLLLDRVQRATALSHGNVNAQLLVEEIVITWARCLGAGTR